jgi:hypothetical protein
MINYYKNIDEIPLYNWLKINEGDLTFCRKNLSRGSKAKDLEYYEIIKDTNYEEFGVDGSYLRLLDLYLELAELRLDWVISGDNFIKNRIGIIESEIEDIIKRKDESSGDIGESIIVLSKWVGYRVDIKVVTVKEFRNMVSLLKKEAIAANKKK